MHTCGALKINMESVTSNEFPTSTSIFPLDRKKNRIRKKEIVFKEI
jgi:hypothetical protein